MTISGTSHQRFSCFKNNRNSLHNCHMVGLFYPFEAQKANGKTP
jgi:hypothetical protein